MESEIASLQLEPAARAMESLGNPIRLTLYRHLIRAGPDGLAVGALQQRLEIPNSTLSHHIHHLMARDLVTQNREGRVLRCCANFTTMNNLLRFLTDECCVDANSC